MLDLEVARAGVAALPSDALLDMDPCGVSTVGTELKDMSRFQRAIAACPLTKPLGGGNVTSDLTKLKRAITQAQNEGEKQALLLLTNHYHNIAACTGLAFTSALQAPKEDTVQCILHLESNKEKNQGPYSSGIPKRNYGEWCMARAVQVFPPLASLMDFDTFWKHGGLYKLEARAVADVSEPMIWSDRFDDDDVQYGSAAQAFDFILQTYSLVAFLEAKELENDMRIFVQKLLKKLSEMPPDYFQDGTCLVKLRKRLRCIIMLIGFEPFEYGASIEDVDEVEKAAPDDALPQAIKNSHLARSLNGAWMQNAGESRAWPEILRAIDELGQCNGLTLEVTAAGASAAGASAAGAAPVEDNENNKRVLAAVNHPLQTYNTWKAQVRGTALPKLEPPLMRVFNHVLTTQQVDEAGPSISSVNPLLRAILDPIKLANSIFQSDASKAMLRRLVHFSTNLHVKERLDSIIQLCDRAPTSWEPSASLNTWFEELIQLLPVEPAVFIMSDAETVEKVLPVLDHIGEFALENWKSFQTTPSLVPTVMACQARVALGEVAEGNEQQTQTWNIASTRFVFFNAASRVADAVSDYNSLAHEAEARYEADLQHDRIKAVMTARSSLELARSKLSEADAELAASETDISKEVIANHKILAISKREAVLNSELSHLKKYCGGSNDQGSVPPGLSWSDLVHDKKGEAITWTAFKEQVEATLFSMEKVKLMAAVRSTAESWLKYKETVQFFNESLGEGLEDIVNKSVRSARITVTEFNFASALKLEASDPRGAVSEIKRLTQSLPQHVTGTDLNPTIWRCCHQVLSGEPLSDEPQ